MLDWYRIVGHTVTSCKIHLVWCTKYRYKVLKWEIQRRCRDIIRQTCEWMDVVILKWVVSSDHIHLLVEYPPKLWISEIVKRLKWRSSRILMQEHWELRKREAVPKKCVRKNIKKKAGKVIIFLRPFPLNCVNL